jgi:anti-anti-sigma factor
MVVPAAGGAEHLPATGGGLIGSGVGFPVRSQRLAEGDVVVVHSAGAVDHPGSPRSEGSHELALLASRVGVGRSDVPDHPPVDRLVRTLPDQVRTARHPAGETIVLAGQLLPRPLAPLELDLPASDATAATVRTALAGWLDRLRLTSMDATALQHAVGELVSNSVRHAYRSAPSPGRVRTRAEIGDDGAIQVDVGDDGQWWDSGAVLPTVAGGRGLSLARLLTDDLKVSAAASGTTVSVRLRALRPVTTYDVGAEPEGIVTLHPYRAEEGDASIRVSGHVDAESADELRHALGRATRGTTSGLVVDLTGVTVLEGAGVQVLLEFWRGCRDNGHELELRADAGSVAHDVLATAQLL